MTKPRMTYEYLGDFTTPDCPHCGGAMDGSELTLEGLLSAWPIPNRIEVETDGYAHGHQGLVVTCGRCAAPSAVAIDWRNVKLIAMRTDKDERYLAERGVRAP